MKKNEKMLLDQETILRIERAVRREFAKEEGYYDGRHSPRIRQSEKKVRSRLACRGNKGRRGWEE